MKRKGFTIIEVLIAMSIFSIVILGIEALILYNIKSAKTNEFKETAIYKAEKLLNYLMALPYDNPCLNNGTKRNCQTDNETCCDGLAGDSGIGYSVSETEKDVTKRISVIVESRSGNVTLEQIKETGNERRIYFNRTSRWNLNRHYSDWSFDCFIFLRIPFDF